MSGRSRLRHAAADGLCVLAVALFGLAAAPLAAAQAPAPTASARLWFYQDPSPYVSVNYATIIANGAVIGAVPPYGGVLYRDVPAGHYQLGAQSAGMDVNQGTELDLAPGQQVYVKVENLPDWATPNLGSMRRDTYYLRVIPAAAAQAELGQHRF